MRAARLAFLFLALLPGAAGAAPAVQGPCSQGSCTWFRELGRATAGSDPRGTLLRLRLRWWESADPRGRGEARAIGETLHARCSGTAPALVERRGGRWRERPLDPGDPAPAGVDRVPVALYAWACHGLRVGDAASPALAALYPARPAPARRDPRPLPEDALR